PDRPRDAPRRAGARRHVVVPPQARRRRRARRGRLAAPLGGLRAALRRRLGAAARRPDADAGRPPLAAPGSPGLDEDPRMRLGVVADVHANLPALEAALEALSGADALVC